MSLRCFRMTLIRSSNSEIRTPWKRSCRSPGRPSSLLASRHNCKQLIFVLWFVFATGIVLQSSTFSERVCRSFAYLRQNYSVNTFVPKFSMTDRSSFLINIPSSTLPFSQTLNNVLLPGNKRRSTTVLLFLQRSQIPPHPASYFLSRARELFLSVACRNSPKKRVIFNSAVGVHTKAGSPQCSSPLPSKIGLIESPILLSAARSNSGSVSSFASATFSGTSSPQISSALSTEEDSSTPIRIDDMRAHQTVLLDGHLYKVISNRSVKSGRGVPVYKAELRSITTGTTYEKTFKASQKVYRVELKKMQMEFMYKSDDVYVFQDTQTWEEHHLRADQMGDAAQLVCEGSQVTVAMFEGSVVDVILPPQITVKVEQTESGHPSGSTSQARKHAQLEGGLQILVPFYINTGDKIVVSTSDKAFVKRA